MHLSNSMLRGILTPLMTEVFHQVESSLTEKLVEGFHNYFPDYQITTSKRIAAFISQAAHETGGFKWFYELGGKSYFNKYDPGTSIGKRLGNTQPGDGYRFRGRGIFHLTGRYNYEKYSELIDLDLVHNPDLAADPIIACHVACEYWKQNNLNPLADAGDLRAITKRINGGYNGWNDRLRYYNLLTDGLNRLIDQNQDLGMTPTPETVPPIVVVPPTTETVPPIVVVPPTTETIPPVVVVPPTTETVPPIVVVPPTTETVPPVVVPPTTETVPPIDGSHPRPSTGSHIIAAIKIFIKKLISMLIKDLTKILNNL